MKLILCLWKSSYKFIWHVIFGIAIITMFVFSLSEISSYCIQFYTLAMTKGNSYDISITRITTTQQERVEKYCSSQGLLGYFSYSEIGTTFVQEKGEPFSLAGISGDIDRFGGIHVIEGRYPQKSSEICIEKSANDSLPEAYQLGDMIHFTCIAENNKKTHVRAKIVGFVDDFSLEGNYIFMDNKYVDEIKDKLISNGLLNYTNVFVSKIYDDVKVSNTALYFTNSLKISSQNVIWNEDKLALYGEKGSYYSVAKAIRSLNVIIVLFGIVFMFAQIYNMYLLRNETFSTLRCLGYSINRMIRIVLLEMLMLCIPGMVIGFIFGVFLNYIFLEKVISCFVSVLSLEGYYPSYINFIKCIAIILFVVVISILFLAININKSRPVEMIYHKSLKAKENFIINEKRGFAIRRYIKKNSTLNNVFSFLQFCVLSLSCLLCAITFTVADGYRKEADNLDQIFPLQITAGADGSKNFFTEEEIDRVKHIPGVEYICTEYISADFYAKIKDRKVNIVIYSDEIINQIEEDNLEKETKKHALYIGDKLTETTIPVYASKELRSEYSSIQPKSMMTITGSIKHTANLFSKDYDKELFILSEDMAASIGFPKKLKNTICFHCKIGNENIKTKILNSLGGIDKYYVVDNVSQQKNHNIIKGMIFLSLYILFMLLVSVVSVVSLTYHYSYCTQYRELGILRVMGMSKLKELLLFSLCNCILSLKGVLCGCVISVPINAILLEIFYEEIHFNPVIYICIVFFNMIYVLCYGLWVFRKNISICNQINIGE